MMARGTASVSGAALPSGGRKDDNHMSFNQWPELSVPVMNDEFTRHRDSYLRALKRAGTDLVFLSLRRSFDEDRLCGEFAAMPENIRALEAAGFAVGCWIQSFGFGNPLSAREEQLARYQKIVDVRGATCGDAFCPTDAGYTAFVAGQVKRAARAGAKIIMLDDDLCLNIRPGLGCACPEHLKRFGARLGRRVERHDLERLLYAGAPTRERRLWIQLMGDTLKEFCAAMRTAVDEVNPAIRLGFCAGYTSWDMEGADALELAKTLAGSTRPFLRLSGAPYWAEMRRFPGQTPAHIVEFTRMQAAWCRREDVDFFSENDSYPRPRYRVPAARMETFDFCMAAAGYSRQLKYLMDYFSKPDYETGYLDAHVRDRDMIRTSAALLRGLEPTGVCIHEPMRRFADMLLPNDVHPGIVMTAASFSASAALLSGLGLSTSYENDGGIIAAFGDAGRTVPLAGQAGYILDCTAAMEMSARGVDVGLADCADMPVPSEEFFIGEQDRVELNWLDLTPRSRFYRGVFHKGAEILSVFRGEAGEAPASYFYTNAEGQSFLVFLFRADTLQWGGSLFCSYYRQAQILDACRRMGRLIPAWTERSPGCWMLCRESSEALGIALCNFSLDEMNAPVIRLARAWTKAQAAGCQCRVDGDRLLLSNIPPYGFAAVRLER